MSNEAYVIYNELDRVLTFYYDELLQHRSKSGTYIFDNLLLNMMALKVR